MNKSEAAGLEKFNSSQEQEPSLPISGPVVSAVKEPFLKQCCCFTLRTGCLILGWLTLVMTVLQMIISIIAIIAVKPHIKDIVIKNQNFGDLDQEDQITVNTAVEAGITIGIVIIVVIYAVVLLSCILLLWGTYKQRPSLLKAYVIITIVLSVLAVIGLIHQMIKGQTYLQVVITVFSIAFQVFSAIIAYSHRQELLQLEDIRKAIHMPPPYSAA